MNDHQALHPVDPTDRKTDLASEKPTHSTRRASIVPVFLLITLVGCSDKGFDTGVQGQGGSSGDAATTNGGTRAGENSRSTGGSAVRTNARQSGTGAVVSEIGGASNVRGSVTSTGGTGATEHSSASNGGTALARTGSIAGSLGTGNPIAGGSASTGAGGKPSLAIGGTVATTTATGGIGSSKPATTGGTEAVGGASAATAIDLSLPWDPTNPSFTHVKHPLAPNARLAKAAPLPTNAFWQNVVLGAGNERFNALPYDIRVTDLGLGASRPGLVVSYTSVISPDVVQLRLGATEGLKNPSVTTNDLFSATLRWKSGTGQMTAPVVYGSPYVSAYYEGLTPSIDFGGSAVLSLEASTLANLGMQRLDVRLNNGQRWLIYAPQTGTWSKGTTSISLAQIVTGWVRGALCPSDATASELDAHAAVVPVGAELTLQELPQAFRVGVEWKTEGTGLPLMMTLPHHRARLGSAVGLSTLQYRTLKGVMQGFEAERWTLEYPRDRIRWRAPRPIAQDKVEAVRLALMTDKNYVPVGDDPYFGGKALAKLGRLALIADELGELDARNEMVERLRARVEAWLSGTNPVPLAYDEVWGGLVTQRGMADSGQDFGMGYYNDHHFHFGYHLYAAAVVAHFLPDWGATWTPKILFLVRDIANPSVDDRYFPRFRNFDWFVGHSWASGLFPFGDGRNQESTSEAVNAWTAVELLGDALRLPRLQKVGEAMRLVETGSAQAYWQIQTNSAIYDEPYASRHVVGVLWETKVDFATFFGSNPEYIYGIQMIPFTPSSESLLPAAWLRTIEPQISAARSAAVDGWKGLLWMGTAVHDSTAAWNGVQQLAAYDDGNSRTNTLYWVATRP